MVFMSLLLIPGNECERFNSCYDEIAVHHEQLRAKRNPQHVLKNVQCLKSIEVKLFVDIYLVVPVQLYTYKHAV